MYQFLGLLLSVCSDNPICSYSRLYIGYGHQEYYPAVVTMQVNHFTGKCNDYYFYCLCISISQKVIDPCSMCSPNQ